MNMNMDMMSSFGLDTLSKLDGDTKQVYWHKQFRDRQKRIHSKAKRRENIWVKLGVTK